MLSVNVVLSITSIPERIKLFLSSLDWLKRQTVQPKLTVIWLGSDNFTPSQRQELQDTVHLPQGVEIRYCPDLGPQTKLVYALQEFGGYPIVTADDDILYPPFWLEELYSAYQSGREHIHCFRAHEIRLQADGRPMPYMQWNWTSPGVRGPSSLLFATGTSGIIYPPDSLSHHVFDHQVMKALCPTADDIWFKAMALLASTSVQKVRATSLNFPQIYGSERRALWRVNLDQNDIQLRDVFAYYDLFDRLIC